jgi:hypothetical protein
MPRHLRTGIKRKGVRRQSGPAVECWYFGRSLPHVLYGSVVKTLLLKLNGMVINLLYLRNIPHSGNGLPTPLESTMKRKPSQEFATLEFEIR